jgi:hypothetical protein
MPYGSFLRNDLYDQPVLCRKYLFYYFILLNVICVAQFRFVIDLFRKITSVKSDALRVHLRIMLIIVSSVFITYLITAITRLIGARNFFKISRKLLSVGSFVNYHEGSIFCNAVIALHFALFIKYLFRFWIQLVHANYEVGALYFFITGLICEIVTSFAAVQFLYLVFTLRRHFMLLSSSLREVMVSTEMSEHDISLNVRTVSDFSPGIYSIISDLRDILYHHMMLCDVFELINTSYSLQVLAFIGSKFVSLTVLLYLVWWTFLDYSFSHVIFFAQLIALFSFEVIELVSVVYCCKAASFQVGTFIITFIIFRSVVLMKFEGRGGI